ncbi:MAG: tRNA 2-thiouridine(34) synthase MnmA [Clostridia bacterium]|nr:tRNA 2-thiouridine(34) synthase MnmA [Clostridia bacterium]
MAWKIVVGMSGGVDSAVAALLLHRDGHEVIGVFMKNWEETDENGVCLATQDYADVEAVCRHIGIPHYTVNFTAAYKERVFAHFLSEYQKGRTPNPDVLCNREIKFDAFLDFSVKLGADKLATGHFANLVETDGKISLLRGADPLKDQSYFLYMLTQEPLRKALFPVGGLTKEKVRQIAREASLPVAEKKDSTGICFIGERNFKTFLQGYMPTQPGDIVTADGARVGRHDGLTYYTLGQRRGLGIGGAPGNGGRWFVIAKNTKQNTLIVSQGEDSKQLYSQVAWADGATWISGAPPAPSFSCTAKYRYRQPDQGVRVSVDGGQLVITADVPQRAVTPGQSVVFYKGETCLGGAVIDRTA